MNKVILTGRITRDLELRYTENNKATCEFTIAINRVAKEGEKKADFIYCKVYNTQAENLTKYQGKGSLIGVEGEIINDQWTGEDGKSKNKTYVLVNKIEFLGSKTVEVKEKSETEILKEVVNGNPFEEFGQSIEISEDDLPF